MTTASFGRSSTQKAVGYHRGTSEEVGCMPNRATRGFWLAASVLTAILTAELIARANVASSQADRTTTQTRPFTGQVLSASGALVVGGAPANPGHPVAGATIHLVPITAIDVTTPMTASAIYAPPYPAEAYDEPLEDAIRLQGATFPQSTTDAQGNFVIAERARRRVLRPCDARPERYRTPARWGPEQTKLFGPSSCAVSR